MYHRNVRSHNDTRAPILTVFRDIPTISNVNYTLTGTLNAARRCNSPKSGINFLVEGTGIRRGAARGVLFVNGPVYPREVPTLKGGQCPARRGLGGQLSERASPAEKRARVPRRGDQFPRRNVPEATDTADTSFLCVRRASLRVRRTAELAFGF